MKEFMTGLTGGMGVVSITFALLGPALAFGRIVPAQAGFGLFSIGMLLGVVSSIAGLIVTVRSGFGPAAGLALLGVPPALFFIYSVVGLRAVPAINDISTDLVYPPQFEHARTLPENRDADLAFPESFKGVIRESYADVHSLALSATVDDAFARAMDLSREQPGWEVTSTRIDDRESVFEGYATTRVFGFVDDFVVRFTLAEGGGCVVDMRSRSREGKGDLGTNAARIRSFLELLGSD